MVATGTIRTATERRLVEVLGQLDGFNTRAVKGQWYVTPADPALGSKVPNRRSVLIGTPDGVFDPEGIAAGHGPSTDSWGISCVIACTDVALPLDAKQACEDALNAIADELARNGRLGMAGGPRDLTITTTVGPHFGWDSGRVPTAWIDFDIRCFADIERNRP